MTLYESVPWTYLPILLKFNSLVAEYYLVESTLQYSHSAEAESSFIIAWS